MKQVQRLERGANGVRWDVQGTCCDSCVCVADPGRPEEAIGLFLLQRQLGGALSPRELGSI